MKEFEKQLHGAPLGKMTTRVLRLAQRIANEQEEFFSIKGPGRGDHSTAAFIGVLQERVVKTRNGDHGDEIIAEATLLKEASGARVDYWIPAEETIIEIALGLRNPLSEFERDILKAVIARVGGVPVSTLVLLGKPHALKRTAAPWYQQVIDWAGSQGLRVCVLELVDERRDAA